MTGPLPKLTTYPFFTDNSGDPLQNGSIWIGKANTDPRQNPLPIFYDEAGTIPAVQPLKTINGRVARAGQIAEIFLPASPYSILVQDSNQVQVSYNADCIDPYMSNMPVTVPNVAAIRNLDHTLVTVALAPTYYTGIAGGGGVWEYDSTDTSSPDNGGTVLVATDGARFKLRLSGPVSTRQFGAYGNGTAGANVGNDDYATLQNWLNALSPTLAGLWEAGVYNISQTLTKTGSHITIHTDGAANTLINWIGLSTVADFVVFGDGTTTCSYWEVGGIGFESAVLMTGGAACHIRKFMVRNTFEALACGLVANNGLLYHGAWLDLVNVFYLPSVDATKCQGDGLRINGSATDDTGSDVFLGRGNISFSGNGVHQGGGMGGLRTGQVNSFNNGINWLFDTTIVSRLNREIFYQDGSVCDGATIAGIVFDDALTSNAPVQLNGFIGSSGQLGGGAGPWHGVWIKHWANGRISILSGDIFNCKGSGVQKDDQSCILAIGPATRIFNNTVYGVAAAAPDINIFYFGGYVALNTAGNWNANAELANGDTYSPPMTAATGTIGAYTSTMRWSKDGKIATYTVYATITNNGTGAGSLSFAMPFQVRLAVASIGKELTSGKAVTGFMNSNASLEGVTFYDGTYPGSTGATIVISGTAEVQ